MYELEYKGGVEQIDTSSCCKFMVFLLNHGKEIPFWEAKKHGIVSRPQVSGRTAIPKNLYQVDTPIVKVFLYDLDFGRQKITYSFYIHMGSLDTPQTVTIKPISKAGVKSGFYFKTNGRFLSTKEAAGIVEKDSMSYRMLIAQSPIPIDTLRQLVTINRPKVIEQARKVRKLRLG